MERHPRPAKHEFLATGYAMPVADRDGVARTGSREDTPQAKFLEYGHPQPSFSGGNAHVALPPASQVLGPATSAAGVAGYAAFLAACDAAYAAVPWVVRHCDGSQRLSGGVARQPRPRALHPRAICQQAAGRKSGSLGDLPRRAPLGKARIWSRACTKYASSYLPPARGEAAGENGSHGEAAAHF